MRECIDRVHSRLVVVVGLTHPAALPDMSHAASTAALPLSPDASVKRKRTTSTSADAETCNDGSADAMATKETTKERAATPSPLPAATPAAASVPASERLAKLSRVEGGARSDVSSGSPVVLADGHEDAGGGGFSGARSKTDGGGLSYSAQVTPRASPPVGIRVASASTSPRIGSTGSTPQGLPPHASGGGGGTVLAALSARTPASSSLSLSVSAASSNYSTPAGGYSLRASSMHASILNSPTWSPMASSANTPHTQRERGTPFHAADAALAQAAAAAYHAAAASSSAVQPLSVPMTPPSNVASPSASPRRLPDELNTEDSDDIPGELHLDGQHSSFLSPDVYNKLTVNTSSSFLASRKSSGGGGRGSGSAAAARATSPSSSPAHSPTSTASQLRPLAGPPMAPLQLSIGISSPAGSMAVASSGVGLSPRNRSAGMNLTLSPRCPQHTHTSPLRQASSSSAASHASSPRRSNPGSGSNSHGVPSPSSARSGRSAGRSPARSPARSPSSFAAPWAKPFWARLQVTIPELNLPISSPVPIGSPVAVPRPSPAQVARDREREEREGGGGGGVITTARVPVLSPRTAVLSGGDVSASSLLTVPIVPEDGVVSSGPHYAISLLRGRRRHMEDFFLQGTMLMESPEPIHTEQGKGDNETEAAAKVAKGAEESDAAASSSIAALNETDDASPRSAAVPLVNLFGIADGHGKNGALVAQLAAQLLPALFEKNLRQALKAAAAADTTVPPTASHDASAPAAPTAAASASETTAPRKEPSSTFLSPPLPSFGAAAARTSPRAVNSILQSPLTHRTSPATAAVSPLQVSSNSPPLTAASNVPLPSLILSPSATSQSATAAAAAAGEDVTAGGSVAAAPPSPASSPLNPFARPPAICAPEDIHDALDEFRLSDEAAATNPVAHALQNAFLQTDALILAGKATGGSTCTVAYIHVPAETSITAEAGLSSSSAAAAAAASSAQPTLFVGNVGDSRCVLSRGGQALALSSDHKPCRPDERARIERAGGAVVYVSGWRVDGRLNISRALGDAPLKAPEGIAPALGRVIALPELTCTALHPTDEFLILASDGVWSKIDNQRAVDIVRKVLMSGGGSSGGRAEAEPEEVEEQSMPDRPALDSEQQSYVVPTASGAAQSFNPIATPRPLGPSATPLLGRDLSNDSVLMSDTCTPHSTAMSLLGGLNSKGSMGTTMSARTTLSSPAPAARTTAAGAAATPPMHRATTRGRTQQHTSSAGTVSSIGGGFLSPGSSSFLSPTSRDSSTRLTTPTAGLTLGKQESVTSDAGEATSRPQADGDTSAAAATDAGATAAATSAPAPAPSPSPLCCWSSLLQHSEVVSAASEALIQYAFDEANSMDNISVAIVLLAPFQPQARDEHATHTDMQI